MQNKEWAAFELLSDAVIVTDSDGVILYSNDAAKNLLFAVDAGSSVKNILPGGEIAERMVAFEWRGQQLISCVQHFNDGFFIVFNVEDSLRDHVPPETDRLNTAIRQVLSVLSLATDRLTAKLEHNGAGDVDRYLAMVQQSYYRLLRISKNISEIYRGFRSLDLKADDADIVALCREVCTEAQSILADRSIRIETYSAVESLNIYMDSDSIEFLLFNLLSNSVKNTPPGGEIKILLNATEKDIIITVSDNGSGMTAEQLYRLHAQMSSSRSEYGAGLGIAAAMNIAHIHGGSLILESRPNTGTVVKLSLPNRRKFDGMLRSNTSHHPRYSNALVGLADILGYENYKVKYLD